MHCLKNIFISLITILLATTSISMNVVFAEDQTNTEYFISEVEYVVEHEDDVYVGAQKQMELQTNIIEYEEYEQYSEEVSLAELVVNLVDFYDYDLTEEEQVETEEYYNLLYPIFYKASQIMSEGVSDLARPIEWTDFSDTYPTRPENCAQAASFKNTLSNYNSPTYMITYNGSNVGPGNAVYNAVVTYINNNCPCGGAGYGNAANIHVYKTSYSGSNYVYRFTGNMFCIDKNVEYNKCGNYSVGQSGSYGEREAEIIAAYKKIGNTSDDYYAGAQCLLWGESCGASSAIQAVIDDGVNEDYYINANPGSKAMTVKDTFDFIMQNYASYGKSYSADAGLTVNVSGDTFSTRLDQPYPLLKKVTISAIDRIVEGGSLTGTATYWTSIGAYATQPYMDFDGVSEDLVIKNYHGTEYEVKTDVGTLVIEKKTNDFTLNGIIKKISDYIKGNLFADYEGDRYDGTAAFSVYIDQNSPLWGTNADTGVEWVNEGTTYHLFKDVNGVSEWYTNDTGKITISDVPVGSYYIREIAANENIFEINTDVKNCVITSNNTTTVTYNNDTLASVEIHKYDSEGNKITSNYAAEHPENVYEASDDLTNNVFVVLMKNDSPYYGSSVYDKGPLIIKDGDGRDLGYAHMDENDNVSYSNDSTDALHQFMIREGESFWTTNGNGDVTIKYLPEGTYYVKEYSTNYDILRLDEEYHKITLTNDTANISVNTVGNNKNIDGFANQLLGKIEIHKYDEEERKITSQYCTLYPDYCDSTSDVTDNNVFTLLIDSDSVYWNDPKYDNGPLMMKDEDGYDIGYLVYDGNDLFHYTNNSDEANLHQFKNARGESFWQTDANGDVTIKYMPVGTYYLREYSTNGNVFTLDEHLYITDINYDDDIVALSLTSVFKQFDEGFINEPATKTGGLEFVKLDEEGHNAGAGHEYEIYYIDDSFALGSRTDISYNFEAGRTSASKKKYIAGFADTGNLSNRFQILAGTANDGTQSHEGYYVYNSQGTPTSTFVTDEDGRIYIERLPIGTYILKEVVTREDVYDLTLDNYGNEFSVSDENGTVYGNSYTFSVDYKMLTCLNDKNNANGACIYGNTLKNTNGIFKDEATRTNATAVGTHNADVSTTYSFDSTLKDKETLTGVVNEWAPERGSLELTKYDEQGNTGNGYDVANKVFEFYYLDESELDTKSGLWFSANGTYSATELMQNYNIDNNIAARISGRVLALQVDDVNAKGTYQFKHWKNAGLNTNAVNDAVYQFVTDNEGKIRIDQVPVGSYLVVEVGTTNAFILNNDTYSIDVNDGETTFIDVKNYNRNIDLEINKVDEEEHEISLNDALYVVYDVTDTNIEDYTKTDENGDDVEPESEKLAIIRTNTGVDLYDLLIAGTDLETEINGLPVKYVLSNVDYATVDTNGIVTGLKPGYTNVKILGGSYELYGNLKDRTLYTGVSINLTSLTNMDETTVNDAISGYTVVNPGKEVHFYKDSANREEVQVETLNVTLPANYDINTPGTYTVEYEVTTTDHIVYRFTRNITYVNRPSNSCMYYPEEGKYLKNNKVCATNDAIVIVDSNQTNYDPREIIPLVTGTNDDIVSFNNKQLATYKLFILNDASSATNTIIGGDSGVIEGVEVYRGYTGHPGYVIQDETNGNLAVANGKVMAYLDAALTQEYGELEADEHGYIDLSDAEDVGSLYVETKICQDGYYLDRSNVYKIDTVSHPGFLQIKNLKTSRVYLVAEEELPNGYLYSTRDNPLTLFDTRSIGIEDEGGERVSYSLKTDGILNTLRSSRGTDGDSVEYTRIKVNTPERVMKDTITELNGQYDLLSVENNEERVFTKENYAKRYSLTIRKKNGELKAGAIFDLYEVYANGENYVGRYSTGLLYRQYLDDDGVPLSNKKVNIATDSSMQNIIRDAYTSNYGIVKVEDLPDGTYYFQLDRPLKDTYEPTVTLPDGTIHENTPTENDYISYRDLDREYKNVYKATITKGEVVANDLRASSAYRIVEIAGSDGYLPPYDGHNWYVELAGNGLDNNQLTFDIDITNEVQSSIDIITDAVDTQFGEKVIEGDFEHISITDHTKISGLIIGSTYTVKGYLYDKTNDRYVKVNNKPVTDEITFTANETYETLDMTYTFNGSNLEDGQELVVFEFLFNKDGVLIAAHEDIDDENQTVKIERKDPYVITTAKDGRRGGKDVIRDNNIVIEDKVKYGGLEAGKEYTLIAVLMNKETEDIAKVPYTEEEWSALPEDEKYVTYTKTSPALDENGEPVVDENGEPIEITVTITEKAKKEVEQVLETFTTESYKGYKDMVIEFNGEGLNLGEYVVFEYLLDENGDLIASHEDIEDSDQTVNVVTAEIDTFASSKTGSKTITVGKETVIVDKVDYENIYENKKYALFAVLVDKDGNTVMVKDENGESVGLTANTKFVYLDSATILEQGLEVGKPIEEGSEYIVSNGSADVVFDFDASNLKEGEYTVLEFLFEVNEVQNGDSIEESYKWLASHAELDDADQTIKLVKPIIPGPDPEPSKPSPKVIYRRTGDGLDVLIYAGILAAAVAGLALIVNSKRKDQLKKKKGGRKAD